MSDIYQHGHSSNLIGISTALLAEPFFNQKPKSLHISGTREASHRLFSALNEQTSLDQCGGIFQSYMYDIFGYEAKQRQDYNHSGKRRYRNSYLKLIQDWGLDSNNTQAAVLKGWVESRFGLCPTFHKQALTRFMGKEWLAYVEEKMNSRYHNNCIYMQLDLLYEYCQWVIEHFQLPAKTHKTLFRGINDLDEHNIVQDIDKQHKIVRLNSIISFTDNMSIASEFGGYILEAEVPMVKLVFFNDLLPDHALHGESEYLVIGGDYEVKIHQ